MLWASIWSAVLIQVKGSQRSFQPEPPRVLWRLPSNALRRRRPVDHATAAGGRVTAQLPGDRRRATAGLAGDLSHPQTLRAQHRDLLPLSLDAPLIVDVVGRV